MKDLDLHLAAIASGDAKAFALWLREAEPRLRASLRSFAGQADVEAVLQEALFRTWQVAHRVEADGRPNSLLRLTHRIARNLAVSEGRRLRTTVPLDDERDSENGLLTDAPPSDPYLGRTIWRCIAQLTDKPRRALLARLESAGQEDDAFLADTLGMRKNTFLQNVVRARRMVQACLARAGVPGWGTVGSSSP